MGNLDLKLMDDKGVLEWTNEHCPISREHLRPLSGEMRSPFSGVFNDDPNHYLSSKTLDYDDPEFMRFRIQLFKLMFRKYVEINEFIQNKQKAIDWFDSLNQEEETFFMKAVLLGCKPILNVPPKETDETGDADGTSPALLSYLADIAERGENALK